MDATIHKLLRGRASSLTRLMALYEDSYARLLQLLPEPDFPFDAAVSRSALDRELHLRVLERSRYTVTLNLSYRFEEAGTVLVEPDVDIRVYRDVALAEALRVGPHAHCAVLRDLDRELVLNKWLAYLLAHGHGFSLAGRPRKRVLERLP
jgi:uncharacterized protein